MSTERVALAAVLHVVDIPDEIAEGDHWPDSEWCIDIENEWAAAILASLDGAGWRLTARDKAWRTAGIVWHERFDEARATIATLRVALDGLVEIVSVIGGPLDVCVMEVDAGGPVCRTHYSQPVDEACYFVHQARAALATAKDTP